jgi:hypothetical protein
MMSLSKLLNSSSWPDRTKKRAFKGSESHHLSLYGHFVSHLSPSSRVTTIHLGATRSYFYRPRPRQCLRAVESESKLKFNSVCEWLRNEISVLPADTLEEIQLRVGSLLLLSSELMRKSEEQKKCFIHLPYINYVRININNTRRQVNNKRLFHEKKLLSPPRASYLVISLLDAR